MLSGGELQPSLDSSTPNSQPYRRTAAVLRSTASLCSSRFAHMSFAGSPELLPACFEALPAEQLAGSGRVHGRVRRDENSAPQSER
jgi:hypothetical protein